MAHAKNLLDKWMAVQNIRTTTEAAKLLGKSGSATLSNWRSGYAKPDDSSIARMCEETGENDQLWLGRINAEFEKDTRLRKFWEKLARTAAVLVFSFGLLNAPISRAEAQPSFRVIGAHCILCQLVKRLFRVGTVFALWLLPTTRNSEHDLQMEV